MPVCPIDTGVELLSFLEDVTAQSFWECPIHKGRYVSHGIWGLVPVPRAVIASPLENVTDTSDKKAIVSYYYNTVNKSVWLKLEGEGEQYFEHATTGTGGDLTYLELNTAGISAGNNNLTSTSWNVSKAQMDYFKVTVVIGTVTDFDIAIFEKDTFLSADKRYEAKGLNSTDNWEDDLEWTYIDDDDTKEIHLKITENAGSGTYDVQFRGVKLA